MYKRSNYSYSYGLIVTTKSNKILIIKRKVPYCVQNFYWFLHLKGIKYSWNNLNPFQELKTLFEDIWLPTLDEYDRLDYMAFIKGLPFEDMYDFPHGQLLYKNRKNLYQTFKSAYREFQEETGFRFSFKKEDLKRFPLKTISFIGCDNYLYTQFYFIVNNVKGLRRFRYFDNFEIFKKSTKKVESWMDDRLLYESQLISKKKAYEIFKKQQNFKRDDKHLLCTLD